MLRSIQDHPKPGIKPRSPTLQANSLPTELSGMYILSCLLTMPTTVGNAATMILNDQSSFLSSWTWNNRMVPNRERSTSGCILSPCLFNLYAELLLLLLSLFSRVQLCATPQMAAYQAPPSLGFSRQDHWSGLPFPSPMHESEK